MSSPYVFRPLHNLKNSEMQTKNWPVQNMHLGFTKMHVLNG
jgi:hypothetical protein